MISNAAGNMTQDGAGTGTHTYQRDAEGRMSSVDKNSGVTCGTGSTNASVCYDYNALGQRVQGTYGGASYAGTWEWLFDVNGEELDECDAAYDSGGRCWNYSWVRLGGRSIADYMPGNVTAFNHVDNLGTTTLVTGADGTAKTDLRFYPYGVAWLSGGVGTWDVHFAGMRFPETNFGPWLMPTDFRKFHPTFGRWLSPDPLAGDITNPQSLNRYAYVMNNPTTFIDPLGLNTQECTAKPGYVLVSTNPCASKPAHTCLGMVCADQYYGGSFFEGFASTSEPICLTQGVLGYCNQGGAQANFSANGSDEFDVNDPSSGVYWSAPPGSAVTNSSGRTSTSLGSLGFSDTLWSEATGTSNVLEFTGLDPTTLKGQQKQFANEQQIQDLLTGNYLFGPSTPSATSQGPGVTAFGPVPVLTDAIYIPNPWAPLSPALAIPIPIFQWPWSTLPSPSGP